MSYIEKTVSVSGTEREFIEAFINALTEADSRITCDTSDFDTQFTKESSATVTFTVKINKFPITFIRNSVNTATSMNYNLNYTVNNLSKPAYLSYCRSTASLTSIETRTWKFKIISNENFINIKFYQYNEDINSTTLIESRNISFLISDKNFVSTATSNDITTAISNNFYTYDDEETALKEFKFTNQFNYTLPDRQTKIEKSKPMITSDELLSENFKGLYDCSTVPQSQILVIEDKEYYAINANTLVPIN